LTLVSPSFTPFTLTVQVGVRLDGGGPEASDPPFPSFFFPRHEIKSFGQFLPRIPTPTFSKKRSLPLLQAPKGLYFSSVSNRTSCLQVFRVSRMILPLPTSSRAVPHSDSLFSAPSFSLHFGSSSFPQRPQFAILAPGPTVRDKSWISLFSSPFPSGATVLAGAGFIPPPPRLLFLGSFFSTSMPAARHWTQLYR